MVHVIAVLTAKPGQRDKVVARFNDLVPTVLAEDGCIAYEATIDTESGGATQAEFGPDTFVVIEKWASLAALHAHSASRHMSEFGDCVKDLMESRRVHILSPS